MRVDGATVLDRWVTGAVKRRILGIKLREGRRHNVVDAPRPPLDLGPRAWGEDERSDTIAGDFAAAATRALSVSVGRIGRRLSVEGR